MYNRSSFRSPFLRVSMLKTCLEFVYMMIRTFFEYLSEVRSKGVILANVLVNAYNAPSIMDQTTCSD